MIVVQTQSESSICRSPPLSFNAIKADLRSLIFLILSLVTEEARKAIVDLVESLAF